MAEKRKDKNRVVLRKGESYRDSDHRYVYRWTDYTGKRHSVYAASLNDLRDKEKDILKDVSDGIRVEARYVTLNDIFKLWKEVKRGLKDTTFQNYCYMYNQFVASTFGKRRIQQITKSDVKRFYNSLVEVRGVQFSTVDSVHTVVHQLFTMAVEDCYIRLNPSDNALRNLKNSLGWISEKRVSLSEEQEKIFLNCVKNTVWYPIFAVMLGTGLRVGEVTGLRWCDVDFERNYIYVNHTLVYYQHREVKPNEKQGSYYAINTTKTPAGKRIVPMLDTVKEALLIQKSFNLVCDTIVDGYSDFIFVNRFGSVHNQSSLNRAIHRIAREYNYEAMERGFPLLPHFSCHSLRHTFATRMCEKGVNVKVIQDVLGHSDIQTTLDIYTDVTEAMRHQMTQLLTPNETQWM